jgi:hypothetical protein
MCLAGQAFIVVHQANRSPVLVRRRYPVLIDGRRAGCVRSGEQTEFLVDPGPHTVQVSGLWENSQLVCLEAAPGSTTHLKLADRPSFVLKVSVLGLMLLSVPNCIAMGHSDPARLAWFLIATSLIVASVVVPPLLVRDYWRALILKPMSRPGSEPRSLATV